MSFGQELKDFVGSMSATNKMFNDSDNAKSRKMLAGLRKDAYDSTKAGQVGTVIANERARLRGGAGKPLDLTATPVAASPEGSDASTIAALPISSDDPAEGVSEGFYAEGGMAEEFSGEESNGAYYTRENARARSAGQPAPNDFYNSGMEAVRDGLKALQENYGLATRQAVPTGEPAAINPEGARNFMRASNAPDPALATQARRLVNSDGQMDDAEESMTVLARAREHFLKNGEPDKARQVAASLLDYYRTTSQKMGAVAVAAGQAGDVAGMAKAAVKAANVIPDGTRMEANVTQDGNINYTQKNIQSGKVVANGVATPAQLLARSMGIANGQAALTELTRAAATPAEQERAARGSGGRRGGRGRGGGRGRVSDVQNQAYQEFMAGEGSERGNGNASPRDGDEWSDDNSNAEPVVADEYTPTDPTAMEERAAPSQARGTLPDVDPTAMEERATPSKPKPPSEWEARMKQAVDTRSWGDDNSNAGTLRDRQQFGRVSHPEAGPAPQEPEYPPAPTPPDPREHYPAAPKYLPVPPAFTTSQMTPWQQERYAKMSANQRLNVIRDMNVPRNKAIEENNKIKEQYNREYANAKLAIAGDNTAYKTNVYNHNRDIANTRSQYKQQQADWLKQTGPRVGFDADVDGNTFDEALKAKDPALVKGMVPAEEQQVREIGLSLYAHNKQLPMSSVANITRQLIDVDKRNPEKVPFSVIRDPNYRERVGIGLPDGTRVLLSGDGFDRLVAMRANVRDQRYEEQRAGAKKRAGEGKAITRQAETQAYWNRRKDNSPTPITPKTAGRRALGEKQALPIPRE